MALTPQRILIISPESWGKSMLSKHHYAIALAQQGHSVWFLLPPWADRDLAMQFKHPKVELIFDSYSIRGARFIPKFLRKAIYRKVIQRMENDCGGTFNLVWSFDNSRFFDLDCFSKALRIHHMMDFHTDYQMEEASATAHICLGVTSGIVAKMKPYNIHSYFIQHGYAPVVPVPTALPVVDQKHTALYTGNLLMPYVEWSWLHALVESNPDVHFFFVGSYGLGNLNEHTNAASVAEVNKIAQNAHVTLLGECTPGQMQSYLQQAEVLFFAYRSNEFPEILANSHKIMAYLASGKPIVCHVIAEYVKQGELLYMSSTIGEYLKKFREVVEHPDTYHSQDATNKRIQWSENNTYVKQIVRIEQLIQSLGHQLVLVESLEETVDE
jgi:glycosyltransferase involved in cell wall biosynthesis